MAGAASGGSVGANPTLAVPSTSGRRHTITNRRDRGKYRPPLTCIWLAARSIFRLKRLAEPRLLGYERMLLSRCFTAAGAMTDMHQVSELLSQIGIGIGYEEMQKIFVEKAWFIPGKLVELRHFFLLAKDLKRRFIKDRSVPASHVAFVALGGHPDLTGDISADDLRSVCQSFKLTIDIDAFVEEHDEDGSGRLEIDEFSALFLNDDADEEIRDDAPTDHERSSSTLPVIEERREKAATGDYPPPPPPPHASEKPPQGRTEPPDPRSQECPAPLPPRTLFAECEQWVRENHLRLKGQPHQQRRVESTRTHSSLPRIHRAVRGASFGTSKRFAGDQNLLPFPDSGRATNRTPRGAGAAPRHAAHNEHAHSARSCAAARGASVTDVLPKLPIIVRDAKGHSFVLQPDFVF